MLRGQRPSRGHLRASAYADGFTVISVYTRAQAIAKADHVTFSRDHRDLVSAPE